MFTIYYRSVGVLCLLFPTGVLVSDVYYLLLECWCLMFTIYYWSVDVLCLLFTTGVLVSYIYYLLLEC